MTKRRKPYSEQLRKADVKSKDLAAAEGMASGQETIVKSK